MAIFVSPLWSYLSRVALGQGAPRDTGIFLLWDEQVGLGLNRQQPCAKSAFSQERNRYLSLLAEDGGASAAARE